MSTHFSPSHNLMRSREGSPLLNSLNPCPRQFHAYKQQMPDHEHSIQGRQKIRDVFFSRSLGAQKRDFVTVYGNDELNFECIRRPTEVLGSIFDRGVPNLDS